MSDLTDFPISKRWPAQHPDRIQLYSFPTPNGVKASIALEELGLPYEAHLIGLGDDVRTPEFLSLNPNNKIPAMIDPDGPGRAPIGLFESGAILIYLADKTGQLVPEDPHGRYEALQWVMFQMGGVGPMIGQIGFFHKFAGKEIEDKRPLERYVNETKRLLGVVDRQLDGKEWMLGDSYSIADIAIFPWMRTLIGFYDVGDMVEYDSFTNVVEWVKRAEARPASVRGLNIPPRP